MTDHPRFEAVQGSAATMHHRYHGGALVGLILWLVARFLERRRPWLERRQARAGHASLGVRRARLRALLAAIGHGCCRADDRSWWRATCWRRTCSASEQGRLLRNLSRGHVPVADTITVKPVDARGMPPSACRRRASGGPQLLPAKTISDGRPGGAHAAASCCRPARRSIRKATMPTLRRFQAMPLAKAWV